MYGYEANDKANKSIESAKSRDLLNVFRDVAAAAL